MTRQCITALMRSIRLKRPEDALVYLGWLRDNGYARQKIIQLLQRAAVRDNLSIALMREAAAADDKTDLKELAVNLARSQKLWSVLEGRLLLRIIWATQPETEYRKHSDEELPGLLDEYLDNTAHFLDVIRIGFEILNRRRQFSISPWPGTMQMLSRRILALRVQEGASPLLHILELLRKPEYGAEETEALLFELLAWISTGLWGQDLDMSPDYNFRTALQAAWIPDWALAEDRRFGGTWDGYCNMGAMVDKYGRLEPEDQGVLFWTRGNNWQPVIKEESGMYLVQSERQTRTFYEVNLANLSCTCSAWRWNTRECKHIRHAREFARVNLPFSFVS